MKNVVENFLLKNAGIKEKTQTQNYLVILNYFKYLILFLTLFLKILNIAAQEFEIGAELTL